MIMCSFLKNPINLQLTIYKFHRDVIDVQVFHILFQEKKDCFRRQPYSAILLTHDIIKKKKRLKALGHTNTSPVVRSLPYAWAQTYHPSSVVAMDSCFSLVRPHQHGMANHPRSLVFSAGDGTGKNSRGVC